MPKAYPNDTEMYAMHADTRRGELQEIVETNKWLVDMIALLALETGVMAVFALLFKRGLHTGMSLRLAAGMLVCCVMISLLFKPCMNIINTAAEAVLMSIRGLLRIPYDVEERHAVFHALWRSVLNAISLTALWGTGLLLAELVHTNVLGQ